MTMLSNEDNLIRSVKPRAIFSFEGSQHKSNITVKTFQFIFLILKCLNITYYTDKQIRKVNNLKMLTFH